MLPEKIAYPRTRFRSRVAVQATLHALLSQLRGHTTNGLHLGAGATKIEGLTNCDLYDPEADLALDALDLSRFADGSVDWIESHHMIEHLSFTELERALVEWRRVLCPRGFLVLTCPDLLQIVKNWHQISRLPESAARAEKLDYMVKMLVGSQEHPGMFHKNAFDARRMARVLRSHGFSVEFVYSPYPLRPTPSLLTIARKA